MLTVFSIYQYVKGKLEKTEKDSPEYNALFEVYNFIRVNMNSSYGMSSNDSTPEYDMSSSDPTPTPDQFQNWWKKKQMESKPNPDWYLKERAAQFMKHELEEE